MGSGLAARKTCTKGGADGYPNVCRTRQNASAGFGFGQREARNPLASWNSAPSDFNSSVARLTSNSIGELQGLVSELQKMQEFLTSEVDSVQRQIDSALGGINIIVETIGPWKSIASSQTPPPGTRNVRAGGLAAHIEQRNRVG